MAGKITLEQLAEKNVFEIGQLIAKGLEPATPAVKKFVDDYKKQFAEVKQIALDFNKLEKSYKVAPDRKTFNKLLQQESGLTEQVLALKKEQDRLEKALISAIAKKNLAYESTNRSLIKQRYELQKSNKLIKEEAILNSKNSTFIEKLNIKRARAIRVIQDLNAKKALGIKLSKKEQKELIRSEKSFKKYDSAIKIAKKSTKQFQENVGNYPKTVGVAISSFSRLLPIIGAGFGLREAWNFTTEMYNTAREAQGVEFAFVRLGLKGEIAFERIKKATRGLLSDIDIKKSIIEFDNFNLSAEQLDTVLEFVSVRATQTGKSFEYLRDSAIEAISKESVRRADNLGLSQKELNDKIKEGGTFLDAFAEIAKREIAEAGDILDETAGAQQKFNAELENFKVSAGSGFIKRFTDSVYDLGTAFLNVLKNANDVSEIIGEIKDYGVLDGFLAKHIQDFIRLRNASAEYEGVLKEYQNIDLSNINEIQAGIDIWSEMKSEVKDNVEVVKILDFFINKLKKSETLYYENARNEHDKSIEDAKKRKELTKEQLREAEYRRKQEAKDAYNLQKFRLEQEIKTQKEIASNEKVSFQDRLRAIQEWEARRIELSELTEEHLLSNKKLTADARKLIEERTSADLIEIYKETNSEIDKLKDGLLEGSFEFVDTEEFESDIHILKQGIKDYAESLGLNGEGAVKQFEEIHGQSFEAIRDYYSKLDEVAKESADLRRGLEEELANSAIGFVNTLFDAKISGIEDDIARSEDYYDRQYELAEGDKVQQDLIRQEQESKRKKLDKKKREEERKAAIFNKLLAVTDIGINLAKNISAINLAAAMIDSVTFGVGGIPYRSINLPIAIGSAALQIGSVLAKPIPKYKMGRTDGKAEWAITGDGGEHEIIERKKGGYEVTPKTDTLTWLDKGDKVYRNFETFALAKGYDKDFYDSLYKATVLGNLNAQSSRVQKHQQTQVFNNTFNDTLLKELVSETKKNTEATKRIKLVQKTTNSIDIEHQIFRNENLNW